MKQITLFFIRRIGYRGKMMQYVYIETTLLSEMFINADREVSKALLITENISFDIIDKMKRSSRTIEYDIILTRL
jgi:hypothetical protein